MTLEIFLLLVIIAIAMVLFSIERLPADVIAIGVLVVITITGLLPPEKAFAGFGNDAVIMILGLLILTAALNRTGLVDLLGQYLLRHTGTGRTRILVVTMISTAIVSTFISNTAAAALFIPIVIGIAHKVRINASQLLMPLAFAAILSSSVTLIATSTNLVVSGLITQNGLAPLGMFELAPVGLPILIIGVLYMLLIGRRMLPDRPPGDPGFEEMNALPYLTEIIVQPGSHLAEKTLSESGLGSQMDLTVIRVTRRKNQVLAPQADLRIQAGDMLLVEGNRNDILRLKQDVGVELKTGVKLSDSSLQSDDVRIVEAILLLRSRLTGRTLKGAHLRERYGLQVLAINRHSGMITKTLGKTKLQLGDVLLIQGNRSNIAALEADKSIHVLDQVEERKVDLRRSPIALAAFILPLLMATFNILPLAVAVFAGVLMVFATRCITPEEAYREVEWKLIILIGCMLGVGAALEYTGAANFLANLIVEWFGHLNPLWLLAAFFFLTMLLTQPMSNQAAAAVVVPIALSTAVQLGVNPRTFAVMIAVGASCSFLTPLEPACLMVYAPGQYRFFDFIKIGALLSLIILILSTILVPLLWPLY